MVSEAKRKYNREWVAKNKEHIREYRKSNKDKRNARRRELYHQEPERRAKTIASSKEYRTKKPLRRQASQYGLDELSVEILLDGGCMICGANRNIDSTVILHIDHNHKTGKTRGVLCARCNLGLGQFNDDPILLTNAVQYIMSEYGASDNEE